MVKTKNFVGVLTTIACAVLFCASFALFAGCGCGNTVKIKFDLNYDNPTTSIKAIKIEKETSVDDNEDVEWPTAPTRDGYTFLGWFDNKDGTGTAYISSTEIDEDVTLYAKWQKNGPQGTDPINPSGGNGNSGQTTQNYTITFDANEGQWVTVTQQGNDVVETTLTYTKTTGTTVALPANPIRTDFTFAGWWTAKTGGTQQTTAYTVENSSKTFYAHWTANSSGDNGQTTIPFEYSVSNNKVTITGYTGTGGVVTIPEEIDGMNVTSFGTVFRNNESVTGVIILANVSSISGYAFDGCSNLSYVVIPRTVTSIGNHAFGSTGTTCGLTTVYFNAEESWSIGVTTNANSNSKYNTAAKYYYSETNQSGKWHFVNDVPTVWS